MNRDLKAEGARWMRQADQDLDDARYLREGGRHNTACFMSKQAGGEGGQGFPVPLRGRGRMGPRIGRPV